MDFGPAYQARFRGYGRKGFNMTDEVSVPFVQPCQNEGRIESCTLLLWAESGGHRIRLEVPGAPKSALPAILAVAEEALTKCFRETPRIAHSTLPAVAAGPIGARPLAVSRASLRKFKTLLGSALGVPG